VTAVIGRSYFTVIACQVAAAVAAVAALRWIAVHVSPEILGRYTLYQSVISAGGLFLISWPNAALLRFGREEWTSQGRLGTTIGARLTLFVVTAAVALMLAWVIDPWLRRFISVSASPFPWVALGLIVMPVGELAVYASQAVGRTSVYGYSPLIIRVGFLSGVLMIPFVGQTVDWTYLAGWFIGASAAAALFVVGTLPSRVWSGLTIDRSTIVTLVRFSWTLPFAGVSAYVVNWIDSWVIREMRGVAVVGVYNWAYQITTVAGLAFAPIAVVLTPRVIDARLRDDPAAIQRYADAILPAAMLLTAAVAIVLVGVRPALQALGAPEYNAAYPVLLILLGMLPIQLITYLVTPITNALESLLPRVVLVSIAIAAINTVGDLLLVPRLGIAGAAIATVSAITTGTLLLVVLIRREGVAFNSTWYYALPLAALAPLVATGVAGWTTGSMAAVSGITVVLTGTTALAMIPMAGARPPLLLTSGLRLAKLVRALTLLP
jgi:O-antigen/teichoic acid export membrane protein